MSNKHKTQLVIGAFLTNFLIMGPVKSMGVYFLEFQMQLDASAKQASMVMSIVYGTYFITGKWPSIAHVSPTDKQRCKFYVYRCVAI